ncbi:MAG: hypothetical protein IJ811_04145, partial [Clostridia bacterium]|nr:hypothetical protein [Clostridia bacterium]
LMQVNEAACEVRNVVDPNAKVIFGMNIDNSLNEEVVITLIATGFTKTPSRVAESNSASYNAILSGYDSRSGVIRPQGASGQPAPAHGQPQTEATRQQQGQPQVGQPQQNQGQQPWTPNRSYTGGYAGGASYGGYGAHPYNAQQTPNEQPAESEQTAYEQPQEEDKKTGGLPGFVKRLFGGKKKD